MGGPAHSMSPTQLKLHIVGDYFMVNGCVGEIFVLGCWRMSSGEEKSMREVNVERRVVHGGQVKSWRWSREGGYPILTGRVDFIRES